MPDKRSTTGNVARRQRANRKKKRTAHQVKQPTLDLTAFTRLLLDAATLLVRKGRRDDIATLLPPAEAAAYLRFMAAKPDSNIAQELTAPLVATVELVQHCSTVAMALQQAAQEQGDAERKEMAEKSLDQLHFTFALMARTLLPFVMAHARRSKNADLLCEAINHATGHGPEAARLIEHYLEVFPDDGRDATGTVFDGSWPDQFTWDAYLRLAALDEMADQYPDHVRTAARQMNAWPLLRFRHTNSRVRFERLAESLELGAEYPLDTSKETRFRPDTPMVRYLDDLVCGLHCLRKSVEGTKRCGEDETHAIRRIWNAPDRAELDEATLQVLQRALAMKPLTKSTAARWAKQVIVPYVMARDAKDAASCQEPALKAIWRQHGKTGKLKSLADFKSRLTPDVVKTLRSMARPV